MPSQARGIAPQPADKASGGPASADSAARTAPAAARHRRSGVRARLLLAFAAITMLALLTVTAALRTFHQVGERLATIASRAPLSLAAIELSRSTERVIAAAPALLATSEPSRRDRLAAGLDAELQRVDKVIRTLARDGAPAVTLDALRDDVSRLSAGLDALDDRVARRLESSVTLAAHRQALFRTHADLRRLLAPWIAILAEQTMALADETSRPQPVADERERGGLRELLDMQRHAQRGQRQFSASVTTLSEIALADSAERIEILRFRSGLALSDLARTGAGLDARLQPLFVEQLARLATFVDGSRSIADARLAELRAMADSEQALAEATRHSAALAQAVDRLGNRAGHDVSEAIGGALEVQRRSAATLVALVAATLVGSLLIVWLYVERRVVRRLDTLAGSTRSIAAGDLATPLDTRGDDEIAVMGHAIDVLRRNTAERDELLLQQTRAAARLEREVASRTAELARADRFKSRFLAAASHDLRQPLHALNLFVGQLGESPAPSSHARLIGRIDASLASMNELFDALLDVSRLEAGVLDAAPIAFPIQRVLARIEATFADAAREKGLALRVVASDAWVYSDPLLLERMASNLVANAVRYTERGGIVVGCRWRGPRLRLDVSDSGPGIAPERQGEVFGEFHQLDAPANGPSPDSAVGLGLGLAIVDGLARLLDHAIELESCPGRGSRFSIGLARATIGIASEQPIRDAPFPDPLRGASIIVIDDDEAVREGMRGTLDGWGCRVVAVATMAAAIEALHTGRQRPDLVVADVHLGGGDSGIAAVAALRAACRADLPALLISGDTAPERNREAAAAGHLLLHKPIPPIRLRAALNRLLGGGRAR